MKVCYNFIRQHQVITKHTTALFADEFQPSFSLLKSCGIRSISDGILVQCVYPRNSVATGFQVIAQRSNTSEEHILYANKTTDREIPVFIENVQENGTYQITIFAITENNGILNSTVEYSEAYVIGSSLEFDMTTTTSSHIITETTETAVNVTSTVMTMIAATSETSELSASTLPALFIERDLPLRK